MKKEYYPCHCENEQNKYYKGKNTIQNGRCEGCEWDEWMGYFIQYLRENEGRRYALEKCLDVEKRDSAQPEAIFINLDDENEKMILEIKGLREKYGSSTKEAAMSYIDNNFINNIHRDIIYKVSSFMVNRKDHPIFQKFLQRGNKDEIESIYQFLKALENKNEKIFEEWFLKGYKLFGIGLQISMYSKIKKEFKSQQGVSLAIDKPVIEVIWENKDKNKLVDKIADEVAEFIINNILAGMYMQKQLFRQTKEFEIEGIGFTVGKSIQEGSPISIRWIEVGGMSQLYDTAGYKEEVERLYQKCRKKFIKEEYKNCRKIFLILNENSKDDSVIKEKVLDSIARPEYIDEVWLLSNETEEYWNDQIDDIDERVVGIRCRKVK